MRSDAQQLATVAAHAPAEIQRALLNILEDLEVANAKLRAEQSRTTAVLDTMGSALVALNPLGVPEMANLEAIKLFGWDQEAPKNSLLTTEPFAALIVQSRQDPRNRAEVIYPAGGRQYKAIGKAVVVDDDIRGFVIVLADITREKELEALKTEFVSITSHQIRTPISAVKWILEILLSGEPGELTSKQKEYLTDARDSNERIIALINDLLDVSRIESGKLILSPVEVDLGVLTGHVLREYEGKISERKIVLSTKFPKGVSRVVADPKYLHQVMSNLISNAVKYNRAGGIITISCAMKGREVLWSIQDTGVGIPRSQHGRVFQKFFRGDNVIREETEGTGLGLYVAKSLIELMGGRLEFESTARGTTFFFTLPALTKV